MSLAALTCQATVTCAPLLAQATQLQESLKAKDAEIAAAQGQAEELQQKVQQLQQAVEAAQAQARFPCLLLPARRLRAVCSVFQSCLQVPLHTQHPQPLLRLNPEYSVK